MNMFHREFLCETYSHPELQIRRGIEDNSKIFFFVFLDKDIWCDLSKLSHGDSSNAGSQRI